ncbi:hypothetical protein [Gordonia araii]|uniref:hypothetical protein n=1 Tax=Gordonia araii TaxID=263909 RepID=UPI0011105FF7|nr:hypothetical protein [Gordonia araii]NNG96229.1 hypothetical protein [Gordonia araii NBRC 100433]
MKLAAAQLGMVQAPAVKFNGHVDTRGGSEARLDVVAGNTGELAGQVSIGSHEFHVTTVQGRTFLTGDAEAWRSLDPPESPEKLAGRPVELPQNFFGVNLAELAPAQLGKSLDPALLDGKRVTVGTPVVINGRLSTPITSGHITSYVSDPDQAIRAPEPSTSTMPTALGRAGASIQFVDAGGAGAPLPLPEQPRIDRVEMDTLSGKGQSGDKRATFKVDTSRLTPEQAQRFYVDYNSKVKELSEAVNPALRVAAQSSGHFVPSPCGTTSCTVNFQIGNTISASSNVTLQSVYANYTITITAKGGPRR